MPIGIVAACIFVCFIVLLATMGFIYCHIENKQVRAAILKMVAEGIDPDAARCAIHNFKRCECYQLSEDDC